MLLLAPPLSAAVRARLSLVAEGIALHLWQWQLDTPADELPHLRLELPGPMRHPSAEAPAAPVTAAPLLRRLLVHSARIQPELRVHGRGWPLHWISSEGSVAALHREGEDLLFVSLLPSRRPEVLRLEDEESVDRALSALISAQWALASAT